jgi:phospholipid/cholesterol/gamma-HCH transport system substrate-binding protein
MKYFSDRNPLILGGVGMLLTVTAVVGAIEYDKLPFVQPTDKYQAYLAEAGGLKSGEAVQVAGFRVGQVESVKLTGPQVLVTFDVDKSIALGDRTGAMVKTKSLLGSKILEVVPGGDGRLSAPIPLDRTTSAYQLPDALGELTTTISGLDTEQISNSFKVLADTFHDTPPDLHRALDGVSRFADVLNKRDANVRNLLANASKVTSVLAERSGQIATLVSQSDQLLTQLKTESGALDRISPDISALSKELSGLVADNGVQLRPALDKLSGALTLIDNRKQEVKQSIKMLDAYLLSLGESVGGGPFFKVYLANLIPGQFIQPFIDSAFSDLGLDPNVKLPSELADPQTGQPGTPALPVPFPRTGQGGEPRLNVPDAITGNPVDPRYPYREPPAAPPPGGPPPGPPISSPDTVETPVPTVVDGPIPGLGGH